MLPGVVLAVVYVIIVISPLLLVTALGLHRPNELGVEGARGLVQNAS